MLCEKIDDLDPNTLLLITCHCGYQRKEQASNFKMASLGFMKLSQLREILSCGRERCPGALQAEIITKDTFMPPPYSTPLSVQGKRGERPH